LKTLTNQAEKPDFPLQASGLSTISLICLVIANMIGAAVYTTSGFALSDLGTPGRVMWAWFVGGLIALCGAVGYGLAAKQIRESGGEYLFLSRWVHPAVGSIAGWISMLAGFSGATALAAVTFKAYLPPLIFGSETPHDFAPYLLIVGLAALNIGRQKEGIWTQNFAVALKLALLVIILGAAYQGAETQGWQGKPLDNSPDKLSLAMFATSLMWISLSYSGFNAAIYVAGETSIAEKRVPLAMIWGTLIVTLFYLLLNAVFVYGPPPDLIAQMPNVAQIAIAQLAGPQWGKLLQFVILLGLFTSVSSLLIAGSRVIAKMAGEGFLPGWLKDNGQGHKAAISLQSLFAVGLVWFANLEQLLGYLGLTLSLCGAATVAAAVWKLPKSGSTQETVALGMSILYVMATVTIAMVAGYHQPYKILATGITVVLGLIYWAFTRTRT
jgi:amino acid transporter